MKTKEVGFYKISLVLSLSFLFIVLLKEGSSLSDLKLGMGSCEPKLGAGLLLKYGILRAYNEKISFTFSIQQENRPKIKEQRKIIYIFSH